MRARCPHCASVFSTDRGGVQFCPSCGKQINVPAPPGTPVASPPESPAAPPPPPPAAPVPGTHGEYATAGEVPPPPPGFPGATGPQPWPAQPPLPPPPGTTTGAAIPTAWERRHELGLVRAYLQTAKDVVLTPGQFWRGVAPSDKWGDALLFGWITTALSMGVTLPMLLLQFQVQRGSLASLPAEFREVLEQFATPGALIGILVGLVLLYPLGFVIGVAWNHLFLMLFGAAKGGFAGTARAMAYSGVPNIFGAVPCLGFPAGIYAIVLVFWGLSKVHRVDWWRPVLAVLLPWLLLCCCGVGVIGFALSQAR